MSDDQTNDVLTVSDGAYTLFVADYAQTDAAWAAYEELKSVEDRKTFDIDGVIVVKRDADGKLQIQKATDHSTLHGLGWGVVGGIVLGAIFPPTIIASAAAWGVVGAAAGKAVELKHHKDLREDLQDAIAPGHSGLVALVSDPGAIHIRKALDKADKIVEKAVDKDAANEIKAAAKQAKVDAG